MVPGHAGIDRLRPEMDTASIKRKVVGLAKLRVVLKPTPDHERPDSEQIGPFKNGEREKHERPPMYARPPCAERPDEQQDDSYDLVDLRQDSRLVVQTLRRKMIGQ